MAPIALACVTVAPVREWGEAGLYPFVVDWNIIINKDNQFKSTQG